MARVSKTVLEQRKNQAVRVEKARDSILENFSKLLTKHLPALVKEDVEANASLVIVLKDGEARLAFRYSTVIQDGASFRLDDGQQDLPLSGSGEPEPEPGE